MYEYTKDEKFLKDNLRMCEKAVDFLKRYVRDLLEGTGKYQLSYDIWEENEGVHLYSLAAIFAAFSSMIKIYNVLGNNLSDFERTSCFEKTPFIPLLLP